MKLIPRAVKIFKPSITPCFEFKGLTPTEMRRVATAIGILVAGTYFGLKGALAVSILSSPALALAGGVYLAPRAILLLAGGLALNDIQLFVLGIFSTFTVLNLLDNYSTSYNVWEII